MFEVNHQKYFRRRQFCLGPTPVNYEGWKQVKLTDKHIITSHPDLPLTVVEDRKRKCILLGYWIDPLHPELSDYQILVNFISEKLSLNLITEFLRRLTGRFILFISDSEHLWVFHDACGLRQVVYLKDKEKNIWCASQPEILSDLFKLKMCPRVLSYIKANSFKSGRRDIFLPHDLTPYSEIKVLLPNHYLDLKTGTTHRYWPLPEKQESIHQNTAISLCSELLQGSIDGAARRFNLKMGISSGLDSRLSLAASKKVKDKITYFTYRIPDRNPLDLEVPMKLSKKLGLKHIVCNLSSMEEEDKIYFLLNNPFYSHRRAELAISFGRCFGDESTVLNSNLYEFSRGVPLLPEFMINGNTLTILNRLDHFLAAKEFQNWIDKTRAISRTTGIYLPSLFELEIISRWVIDALLEYDVIHETFIPYNNRQLIKLVSSVKINFRRGHFNTFDLKFIEFLWPEVLSEPINPEISILRKIKRGVFSFTDLSLSAYFPIIDLCRFLKLCLIRWLRLF